MAAPIRFLSGRNQQQKIGIEGSTDNQKVLEVVGRVGIGTTIFEPTSELEVRGDIIVSGIVTAGSIEVSSGEVNFDDVNVSGVSTFAGLIDANGSLDVDGHTELDDLNVSGVSTFAGLIDANGGLDVTGHTELDNVNVSGVSTFVGISTFKDDVFITGQLTVGSNTFGSDTNTRNLSVSGISTFTGAIDANGSLDVDGHTELDDVNVSGVSTFVGLSTFKDDVFIFGTLTVGSNTFGSDTNTRNLSVSGISTFTGNIDANAHTELTDLNVSGVTTTSGLLDINAGAQANTLKVEDLTDNRVVIAGTGGELEDDANLTFNGTQLAVGVDLDVDGHTELDDVNVSGVSTFAGDIDANGSLDVDGHTELDDVNVSGVTTTGGLLDINAGAQANTLKVEDLTDNRVVIVGTGGELEDDTNLTFNGTQLSIGVNLDVDGHTELDDVNVSGAITATTFTGNLAGTVNTAAQTNITSLGTLSALTVSGNITANGNIVGDNATNITGIAGVTATTLSGTLQTAAQTNITSLGTLTGLDVNGHTELDDVNVSGAITATTFTGNFTGIVDTATQTNITSLGTLTGLDVNGHTELDDVNVSGIITTVSLNVTDKLITTGIGISISNSGLRTAYIEGPEEIWIDPHPTGVGTTSGIVRIRGDLYVDGTEFIVDVDKIELGDFNIGIASTVSTNSLLDGAGFGIGAIGIRKFITWNNATSALMSSENWNLASGKHYEINGTDVLTSDTLGSGVINSSLTSVGTLGALTVSGNVNANGNIIGDNVTNISGINSVTATSFYGSGVNLTALNASNLGSGTVPDARFPATLPAISGVNLTALNASNLGSGTVPDARFPATLPAISGSNLTGITASQIGALRGITINEEGSLVGTASSVSSINFVSSNLTATASGVGATITLTDTPTFSSLNVTGITTIPNISGVTTFASQVNVGTGITLDSTSGIISATAFFGDGQNLSNLINQRIEGLQIFDEGVSVGTGYTFAALDVVGSNISISAVGLGTTARITLSDTPTFDTVTVTNNIAANGNIVGDNSTNITGINQVTATTFSGTATQVTVADESTDTTCFPLFVTAATGGLAPKSGTNLTFNSADGTLTATDFNTTSDENLKDNIHTIEDPLAKVVQIRGVNFDWKETQKPSVGVIAQEVEKVFPELVANGEKKTVNYNGLIGLLIEVVKEQQTQINSLNERLSQLE